MEIVFATHNANKLREIQQIIPNHIKLLSLDDIGCYEEIVEDGKTIEENALIKANYVFKHYKKACFADDTGLCVDALDGEPGVYSARYAGPQKNSYDNNQKLLDQLKGKENREAFFKTVIAYKTSKVDKTFTGICSGKILKSLRGQDGFGYDPLFQPNGFKTTFAEMPPETKNKISHRGLATHKFIEFLKKS
jgi:XTP/dITP diphosphohydrolase